MKFVAPCSTTLLIVLTACSGNIAGGGDDKPVDRDGDGKPDPGRGEPGEPIGDLDGDGKNEILCRDPAPDFIPVRRLTRNQFDNTVRVVFGPSAAMDTTFPRTALREGFRTWADANTVTADGAGEIAGAASAIAKRVTENMDGLLGCTPGTAADDACVRDYIKTMARKAYRRPTEPDELATLEKVYATLRGQSYTPAESVAGVIEVVLQSPQFLYLSEVGVEPGAAPGAVRALTDHEIAARLSYFLLDSPPDDQLAALADEGQLADATLVEEQARRLLEDARLETVLGEFADDWLELHRLDSKTKDKARYPDWNDELKAAMRKEVGLFVSEVALRGDGSLRTLLSAPFTITNGPLAKIYGAANPPAGASDFARVDLDDGQRAGLLTSIAFLSSHAGVNESLPVVRGAWVRQRLLCQTLVPPANVQIDIPPPSDDVTTRERFAQHRTDPACSGCHMLIDPIGFGLEGYDAIGRHRTMEGNRMVDASGELIEAGDDISGVFEGGVELATRMSTGKMAQACAAEQLFSYAVGRHVGDGDTCAVSFITNRFAKAEGNLKELIVAIAVSDAFRYRRMPEVAQ